MDQAIELSNPAAPKFQVGSMQCAAPEAMARGKLADDVFRQWWGNAWEVLSTVFPRARQGWHTRGAVRESSLHVVKT